MYIHCRWLIILKQAIEGYDLYSCSFHALTNMVQYMELHDIVHKYGSLEISPIKFNSLSLTSEPLALYNLALSNMSWMSDVNSPGTLYWAAVSFCRTVPRSIGKEICSR